MITMKSENGTKIVDGKRICVVFGRGLSHDLPPTLSGAARKNRFADEKVLLVREGFKKSKWKFKMAFAMKGGGSRGGLECHIPILKNDFC